MKPARRAVAALVVLLAGAGVGCKPRPPPVGDELFALSDECGQAAEIYFSLRAAAGDYDRTEADRRAKEVLTDVKASCAPASPQASCCQAGIRLRLRVQPGHLANCEDFYKRLRDGGCHDM